jgi:hypothetical protein
MNGKKSKQLRREAKSLRDNAPAMQDGRTIASQETIYNRLKKLYTEGKINVVRD